MCIYCVVKYIIVIVVVDCIARAFKTTTKLKRTGNDGELNTGLLLQVVILLWNDNNRIRFLCSQLTRSVAVYDRRRFVIRARPFVQVYLLLYSNSLMNCKRVICAGNLLYGQVYIHIYRYITRVYNVIRGSLSTVQIK